MQKITEDQRSRIEKKASVHLSVSAGRIEQIKHLFFFICFTSLAVMSHDRQVLMSLLFMGALISGLNLMLVERALLKGDVILLENLFGIKRSVPVRRITSMKMKRYLGGTWIVLRFDMHGKSGRARIKTGGLGQLVPERNKNVLALIRFAQDHYS